MSAPGLCGCGSADCGGSCGSAGPEPIAPVTRFAHAALTRTIVDALGRERALDSLSIRESDDPAIAIADAYAGALHVLGFIAARIAEDGAIATSNDRGSLVELTRLIGYTPRAALASSTFLAVSADTTPGAVAEARVPAATRVSTLPKDGKPPIPFETDASLIARGVWNSLQAARKMVPQSITTATTELVVKGVDIRATAGDGILAPRDGGGWLFARVTDVERDGGAVPPTAGIPRDPTAAIARTTIRLTGGVEVAVGDNPAAGWIVVLGQRAAPFGASAPDVRAVKKTRPGEWRGLTLPDDGTIDLEGNVKEALPGRVALFVADAQLQSGTISSSVDSHRIGFNLSMPVTRIKLTGVNSTLNAPDGFHDRVRELTVHIETQRLHLLDLPDEQEKELPSGDTPTQLRVHGAEARDLPPGRKLALKGLGVDGMPLVELATLARSSAVDVDTVLEFTAPISARFKPESLTISANVVSASQGATISNPPELLGSSSAARERPIYPLAATPVAHVAASTPSGFAPALEVRVDGRLYSRAERFDELTDDRAWRLRPRRDGRFEVEFAGRLPSGVNNVTAYYRTGGGATGNVEAAAVSTIMTPALGVTKIVNLTRAEGGADAAPPDAMRDAGETVTTLGRVVSLADYERTARAFRGVGRAVATELRIGMRRDVILTIGTSDPAAPQPSATLIDALARSLASVSAPGRRAIIVGFADKPQGISVAFAHDPALVRATVEAAVRERILTRFGREARGFGQSLWSSQILGVVQDTPGVLAARVSLPGADPIIARGPRVEAGAVALAELVAIDPAQLSFTEM